MRNKIVAPHQEIYTVTQHGIAYAVDIINDHFGSLVSKVCECLLRKGPLSRSLIKRYTDLSDTQIKNSLLVLIQHNCVQAFAKEETGGFGEASRVSTQYLVLFDNIIHRVRFAKFLAVLSQEEYDMKCLLLLKGLFEHGRRTLNQMFAAAKSTEREGNPVTLESVEETLLKLVNAHYVERCPAGEPVLAPPSNEPPAKKRGFKEIEIPKTIEQQVIEEAMPGEAIRFYVATDTEHGNDGEKGDIKPSGSFSGEKRKHDESVDGFGSAEIVVYRANLEEFIRRLRHKACVDYVRARLDEGAVTVMSAMLDATRNEEATVKTKRSVPLSISSIFEEVIKTEAGRNMTFEHLRAALTELSNPPLVKASDESYTIDFETIIELAQTEEVESVVLKRCGRDAYRMFRLLAKEGRLLETNKIADTTFVEKKDAPKTLYKMWQDGYLQMEKLVITGKADFMVWKVKKQTLWPHFLDEMFHASSNLRQRLAFEREKEKELLDLNADKRIGALEDKYKRFITVENILLASQMKLDDSIMLFHDF